MDYLADRAYSDHSDSCMIQYDKYMDKARECYDCGDHIGENIYKQLAMAWFDSRNRLGDSPLSDSHRDYGYGYGSF